MLFEWLSGRLTPDICDMVRPTRVDEDVTVDEVAEEPAADAPPEPPALQVQRPLRGRH